MHLSRPCRFFKIALDGISHDGREAYKARIFQYMNTHPKDIPGATNMITPMQDALSDGLPMVVFSGQVPTTAIGTDAFQEADVIGLSRSCTKWNVMVKDVAELPRRINEAFEIATSGRPGPVLVDLPKDVTAGTLQRDIPGGDPTCIPGRKPLGPSSQPSAQALAGIRKTANALNSAKTPILYVGAGVLATPEGPELLKALADKGNIPVTTTLQGMGAFDELDPKSLHMLGMHGSAYANLAMQTADVIVALGARFDDRVTGNLKSKCTLASCDSDKTELCNKKNSHRRPRERLSLAKAASSTLRLCPRTSTRSLTRLLPLKETWLPI